MNREYVEPDEYNGGPYAPQYDTQERKPEYWFAADSIATLVQRPRRSSEGGFFIPIRKYAPWERDNQSCSFSQFLIESRVGPMDRQVYVPIIEFMKM